jgi:cyclophilin family peptidyl-prolyl cis-trans isomerase
MDTTSSSNNSRKPKRRSGGRLSNTGLFFRILALFVLLWIIACAVVMKYMFQSKATTTQKFRWEDLITRTRNSDNDNGSKQNVLPASISESHVAKLPVRKPIAPMAYTQIVLTVPLFYNQQIRIQLRSDWSQGSVDYIHRLVQQQCATCSFFRMITNETEKEGILLGTLKNDMVPLNTQPGICPDIDKTKTNANCTTDCGCHGPILERGMVGWVGGTAGGPEFFVNLHNDPLITDVGSKHTIFGQVVDYESFDLLVQFLDEDTSFKESQVLDDVIHFHLELE